MSDGECDEGSNWEAILYAGHFCLNNLVVIVDYNKIQSLDFVKNVLEIEPLETKIRSFNCNVRNINGHNVKQISKSLKLKKNKKPNVIIANTIKGKGVNFMENSILWHYKSPDKEQLKKALDQLK